jgi:hypothetical protein
MWSLYFILGAQELSSNPLHHVYSLLWIKHYSVVVAIMHSLHKLL